MRATEKILVATGALALMVTLVSLLPSDQWYVRTVDLVREPLVWLLTCLSVIGLFVRGKGGFLAVALFGVSILIHLWRMWPYLLIAPAQVALDGAAGDRCFTALAVNVKVKNHNYAAISRQIGKVDPDILFLMETDAEWVERLAPVLQRYPSVRAHPQPEAFGMVFATRLQTEKIAIVENTHRDTPTLYATIRPGGASPVEFIGLHPKPPLPGWDTAQRDRNIINAGVQTPDRLPDAIVMGDFNDVPWSRTTTAFRQKGGWDDPRIGRGPHPTFPADYLFVGWPLDQVMTKGALETEVFQVMPDNGSDHRAVGGRFCLARS